LGFGPDIVQDQFRKFLQLILIFRQSNLYLSVNPLVNKKIESQDKTISKNEFWLFPLSVGYFRQ
jgi:hypothetical protein